MRLTRPHLVWGILGPALWFATDIVACLRWPSYRPAEQSISELTAIGAPTRSLVTGLALARDACLVIFGTALTGRSSSHRAMAATGSLILAGAAIDAFATTVLPRDYTAGTWASRNTANTVVMAAGVGCSIGAMGAGAVAMPGWFSWCSAGIPLAYGMLTLVALVATSHRTRPSPTTGAQERTMAYSYQLWLAGLAVVLMRHEARRPGSGSPIH